MSGTVFDDTVRGVPYGETIRSGPLPSSRLNPLDGSVPLPVLTADLNILEANSNAFLRFCAENGVLVAPHAKTPMIPEILTSLVAKGAWGLTAASTQQLAILLRSGVRRIILAAPPGGAAGCRHLAALIAGEGAEAEIHVFIDSVAGAESLAKALEAADAPPVRVLVEAGLGRSGARTLKEVSAVRDAILRAPEKLVLSGVASYEAAAVKSPETEEADLKAAFALLAGAVDLVAPSLPDPSSMIITAGGTFYFNEVVGFGRDVAARYPGSQLVLRSGSLFFSDDGAYSRSFDRMASRGLEIGRAIRPVLSIWVEILSRPEKGLAIAGFGHREAANDMGLPIVRRAFRDGVPVDLGAALPDVLKLNDHHAFLTGEGVDALRVGDIIEVGICHPCTTLQRWRLVYGIGDDHRIEHAFATCFS